MTSCCGGWCPRHVGEEPEGSGEDSWGLHVFLGATGVARRLHATGRVVLGHQRVELAERGVWLVGNNVLPETSWWSSYKADNLRGSLKLYPENYQMKSCGEKKKLSFHGSWRVGRQES